jgi:5,5'-dehydrodivanillate O-demethylase oxygenase subunit
MAMTEAWQDITHTGPGTLAGRYMRTFWQPVFRSSDLPAGRAMPIRIMNDDFTVYRGEGGEVHLLDTACAHRGTQLSVGWVEGDNVRCRYHGWMYGPDGQCVEQPLEDRPFCERIRIKSFPVQEYLGLIFAYFGDGEPPAMKRFPDAERPGYLEAGPPEHWPANFMTRIDNDARHVVYTHQMSFNRAGTPMKPVGYRVQAEETEYGVRTFGPKVPGESQVFIFFHMPNINQVRSTRIEGSREDARALAADRFFWRVPVDDDNCINFVVDYIPLTAEEAERYRERRRKAGEASAEELNALGEQILAGKLRIEDLPPDMTIYKTFWIEDYVTQIGQRQTQGRVRPEHLGNTDAGVFLKRKIWERELKALAEGRPLKVWHTPAGLADMQDDRHPVVSAREV